MAHQPQWSNAAYRHPPIAAQQFLQSHARPARTLQIPACARCPSAQPPGRRPHRAARPPQISARPGQRPVCAPLERPPTPGSPRVEPGRMFCHTLFVVRKIAVTLDQKTVADLDRWVKKGKYPNRSRALQSAVNPLSEREKRTRLSRELAKLDPREERAMAEEGSGEPWPEY
jgi:Arc/MetJ-type ribon-helix-helix transcriptional regulator